MSQEGGGEAVGSESLSLSRERVNLAVCRTIILIKSELSRLARGIVRPVVSLLAARSRIILSSCRALLRFSSGSLIANREMRVRG